MKAYKDMTREELFAEKEKLEAMYQDYKGQNLALNMSRGKPSASQLDLSKGMMDVLRSDSNLTCEDGTVTTVSSMESQRQSVCQVA